MTEKLNTRGVQIQSSIKDLIYNIGQTLSSSLGPRGTDKMLTSKKKTLITNDGATILDFLGKNAKHPILRLLDSVAKTQDNECGDGTTTVILLLSEIYTKMCALIQGGISKSKIIEALEESKNICENAIFQMAYPVFLLYNENKRSEFIDTADIIAEKMAKISIKESYFCKEKLAEDRNKLWKMKPEHLKISLKKAANTSLSSKVVSSVAELSDSAVETMILTKGELKNIKVIKKLGAVEETFSFLGIGIKSEKFYGIKNFSKNRKVKAMAIRFCISPPKTNLDSKVEISNAELMEQTIKEERNYILEICKKIHESGAELILIQKSILRTSISELAIHYLNKLGVSVLDSIEREDICYLEKSLGLYAVSDVDFVKSEFVKNVHFDIKDEIYLFTSTEVNSNEIVTVILKGENNLILDEVERSMNDAWGVIRSLIFYPYLVPGGGVVEMNIVRRLKEKNSLIFSEIANSFEIIPFLLAKNAGMDPIDTVNRMRFNNLGVNVRSNSVSDMVDEDVLQPMKINFIATKLVLESVIVLLNVDDILPVRK